jgi:hypothetical protein
MDNAAQRLESCIDPVYHPVRGKDAKTLNLTPRLHKIRDTLDFEPWSPEVAAITDQINALIGAREELPKGPKFGS